MGFFSMSGLIILGLIALFILWAISTYNSIIRLRNMTDEGWSGIDVQLKRRYDLIPNLVSVVQEYRIHEKEVLEKVTQMRSVSMNASSIDQKAAAEQGLTGALKTLFAVAENYPDLKANENFAKLQQQLADLESEIQLSRRYYNGAARNYNISIQSFPANTIAKVFSFTKAHYFELDAAERENPTIKF